MPGMTGKRTRPNAAPASPASPGAQVGALCGPKKHGTKSGSGVPAGFPTLAHGYTFPGVIWEMSVHITKSAR